jgi:hypothetical protein
MEEGAQLMARVPVHQPGTLLLSQSECTICLETLMQPGSNFGLECERECARECERECGRESRQMVSYPTHEELQA